MKEKIIKILEDLQVFAFSYDKSLREYSEIEVNALLDAINLNLYTTIISFEEWLELNNLICEFISMNNLKRYISKKIKKL